MALRVRDELRGGIGLLLVLQFATAAAGIGLLGRTGPAIELILAENDTSLEAAEAALVVLATPAPPPSEGADPGAREAALAQAVARLRANITEDEETPMVRNLEADLAAAAQGVPAAVARVTAALAELTRINRASMRAADAAARRAATAGGWALTTLALFTVLLGLLLLRRFHRRLVVGLGELQAVSDAQLRGDPWRRVNAEGMATELEAVGRALNTLLDARTAREVRPSTVPTARMAVLALLDARPEPLVLLEPCGDVFASNAAGLDRVGGAGGAAALRTRPDATVETLSRGFVLVRLAPPACDASAEAAAKAETKA